jgi:hypothetical protein
MAWNKATDWKIYNIYNQRAFDYPIDTLSNFPSYRLKTDSMQDLLSAVVLVKKEIEPVWMGYYIASCRLPDGTLRKIEISNYGGFFYDEKEKLYYQLPLERRKDWLNYLSDCGATLPADK